MIHPLHRKNVWQWLKKSSTNNAGEGFLGFVLLSTPEFDVKEFRTVLMEDWGIECPEDSEPLKAGELFVKIASSCLKASNALGIYDCGTVWLAEDYIRSAMVMKDGRFPLTNLVFVGLYQNEKGVSSWTNGLRSFGKEELEVIGSSQQPSEVYELMLNISSYLVQQSAVLHDGETLGYTAKQKLPLTLSQGIYVEGQSMKIGF